MLSLWPTAAAALVFFLPGWGLALWLLPRHRGQKPDIWSSVALSGALSIAVWALAGLACRLAGISPGFAGVMGVLTLSLGLVLAGLYRKGVPLAPDWGDLAIGLAAGAALVLLRLHQARDLVLPNWVDGVHHTYLVRILLETGGVPVSVPVEGLAPFHYHFGYHLVTAIFAGLAGLGAGEAVLASGLPLFLLVMLGVRLVGLHLGLSRRAAWLTALLSAFFFFMPAYYVSWGRYTLLAGVGLLLPALALVVDFPARGREAWQRGAALALLSAGMALTHYFVLLLFGLFLLLNLLAAAPALLRGQVSRQVFTTPILAAALGVLAALPWLGPMVTANRAMLGLSGVISAPLWSLGGMQVLLEPRHNLILYAVAAVLLVPALFSSRLRPLALLGLVMALMGLPFAPRLGPFRFYYFVILLFLPASLLLAWGLDALVGFFSQRWGGASGSLGPRALGAAFWLNTLLFTGWGIRESRTIVNTTTIIARAEDRAALDWVQGNTSEDARFYVNTSRWDEAVWVGLDGGYWIMPSTGRRTMMPPAIYTWEPGEVIMAVNERAAAAQALKTCPELAEFMREQHLTHAFLTDRQGNLHPADADGCADFDQVYRSDGVGIYRLRE